MSQKKTDQLDKLSAELSQAQDRIQELEGQIEASHRRIEAAIEVEELAKSIITQSPAVLFRRAADENAQLIYVSENMSQWGYDALDFLTEKAHFRDIVYPDDIDRLREEITGYRDNDVDDYQQEYRIITKDGQVRWVDDRTFVVRGPDGEKLYNQGLVVDVTERKLAELALQQNEAKLRRILETAGEGYAYMSLNMEYLEVNQAFCDMLGYSRAEIIGKTPFDLSTPEYREYMMVNYDRLVALEKRVIEGELVAKDGHVVPVLVHANTLRDENGEPMANVAFVTDMTEHKKAMALAGEVQKSLLPQEAPQIKGFDIAGKSISCEDVGGDYFDFFHGICDNQENMCITVGDVSGHGVDAALLMAAARAFMRARAQEPGSMSEIVSDLNRHLAADLYGSGRFMTLFALAIQMEANCLTWVRAGHDPALLYSAKQDSFSELSGDGLPIAVLDAADYAEEKMCGLEPGLVVAIGTDGIWEAVNPAGEMFGKERFQKLIRKNASKSSLAILDSVYQELDNYTLGVRNEDDITLVIIKVVD